MTAETKQRVTIPVSGMHCAACVSKVERALGVVIRQPVADERDQPPDERASPGQVDGQQAPAGLEDAGDLREALPLQIVGQVVQHEGA